MDRVNELIDSYREEMIATLARWIRIPSVQGEAEEGMPFGEQLLLMLEEGEIKELLSPLRDEIEKVEGREVA